MKKLIIFVILIITMAACRTHSSTANVSTDSTKVDTTQVDTTQVK